jgi:tyrosine-protein phosphatase YwqE
MIDIHSHILPGIDDGAPDLSTALDLCKGLVELGFSAVIATPHIISDVYPNTEENIITAFKNLNAEVVKNKIPIKLNVAAEYLLDDTVLAKLSKDVQLLSFPNKGILLEFSYAQEPTEITEYTFPLLLKEYKMVLAHPERYSYWHHDLNQFEILKDMGFAFQLNALSLTNYYGKQVKETAQWLLNKGMIDYIGTDIHHERHLKAMIQFFGGSGIKELSDKYKLKNNQLENF